MKRELFDIWEDQNNPRGSYPWQAQMVNYVGSFPTRETAERFIEATKKARTQDAKSVVQKSK